MDNEDFFKNKELAEKNKVELLEKRKQASKEQLKAVLTKHMKTVMIGSVCAIEQDYGELWGSDVDEKDLSEDHIAEFKLWQEVRKRILDLGNLHIRKCLDELEDYEINYSPKKVTVFFNKG